jgi:hypothetical protein
VSAAFGVLKEATSLSKASGSYGFAMKCVKPLSAACSVSLRLLAYMPRDRNKDWAAICVAPFQLSCQFQATPIRHHYVEQHDVRLKLVYGVRDISPAALYKVHVEALAPQKDAERHYGVAVVICDQHAEAGGVLMQHRAIRGGKASARRWRR